MSNGMISKRFCYRLLNGTWTYAGVHSNEQSKHSETFQFYDVRWQSSQCFHCFVTSFPVTFPDAFADSKWRHSIKHQASHFATRRCIHYWHYWTHNADMQEQFHSFTWSARHDHYDCGLRQGCKMFNHNMRNGQHILQITKMDLEQKAKQKWNLSQNFSWSKWAISEWTKQRKKV